MQALEPFTTNSWSWSNNNMVKLQEELSREDKAVFGFDIKIDFDWKEYLETYVQVFIIDNGFRKIKKMFPKSTNANNSTMPRKS